MSLNMISTSNPPEIVRRKRGRPRKDPNAPVVVKEKKAGKRRGRPPKTTVSIDNSTVSGEEEVGQLACESIRHTVAEHNQFMGVVNTLSLKDAVEKLLRDLEIELLPFTASESKSMHIRRRVALMSRIKELV